MDTIDELGRRAARTALAEAEAYTDVDAGLARIVADDEDVDWNVDGGSRRGWVVLAAAAAVVAAAVTAGVVWSQEDPSPRLVPATPPAPTPAPTTPTTEPSSREPSGLAVSYVVPPPTVQPEAFATIDVPGGESGARLSAAVMDDGGVVFLHRATDSAIVVDRDGASRRVPLDVMPGGLIAAGPGDVLYGLRQTPQGPETRMLAIALSGERAGQVVGSMPPFDINPYTHAPEGAIGHGPSGIIDRHRRAGEQLIGYVDATGQPLDLDWDAPPLVTIDENETVRTADGATTWALDIERDPGAPTPLEGPMPPTTPIPTADGGAVYWTGIGAREDFGDYRDSTITVIAVLAPDGSGQWYRLPEGWTVAASDIWGTILTRRVGEQFELATFPHQSVEPPPPTAAPTTTAPTTTAPTTTSVPPAASSPLATLAEAIGASTAIAREPRKVTVFADGTTTEVATPPDVYVQTDGTMLWWDIVTGETTSRSAAATLDGTVVCEVEGTIHRVRQEPDGGYVASVERASEITDPGAEDIAVPNYAVDCETGETQPIEPVRWLREAGSRFVQSVGDRTFTGISDAEGNADITNEDGISINGDDYAGYHEFNADGSRVVYGDMTDLIHVTAILRSRDTTTGELLWSTELDRPVGPTYWYGDRIVALAPAGGNPGGDYEAVIVLDAGTGEAIEIMPTTLDLAFVE